MNKAGIMQFSWSLYSADLANDKIKKTDYKINSKYQLKYQINRVASLVSMVTTNEKEEPKNVDIHEY